MTEHVLAYDHSIVPQETFYDCGPGSAQVVLNARGVIKSEQDLIALCHTTENGTDYVGLVADALNSLLPEANYTSIYLSNDPPTQDQKDALWAHVVASIDADYGVVMNWDAPPSNYPRGVKGSINPAYAGGEVMHYIGVLGYDDGNGDPAQRALWIADSGFRPFGYWISFDQAASLIPPKGYCYADPVPAEVAPEPEPQPEPRPAPTPAPAETDISTLFADVSEFQCTVDDSYPYEVLSIRVCDGDYRDRNFAQNYAWMRAALDSGRLKFGIVYTYVRPATWQSNVDTVKAMIDAAGGLHPRVALMLDVERGGNPAGDQSEVINQIYWALADYIGDRVRVIGYANAGDYAGMWATKPPGLRVIGAGYPTDPVLPGQLAHQYTDGTGFGEPLPQGCPPFGDCDMNSADGLSAEDLAALCGVTESPTTTGGFLMALTDDEQHELLSKVRDIWDQLRGPGGQGWPQLGQNGQGQNLTPVDALAAIKTNTTQAAKASATKAGS